MTRLIGVTHGAHERNLLTGTTRELPTYISPEIIDELSSLDKKLIVGIEGLEIEAWERLTDNLRDLTGMPTSFGGTDYFDRLPLILQQNGVKFIHLENEQTWMKHNAAVAKLVKLNKHAAFISDSPFKLTGFRQRTLLEEERFAANLEINKIHLIERDEELLKAIALKKPDVVFAGLGHTDYWMSNQDLILKTHGITFSKYVTDDRRNRPSYCKNPVINPKLVYEFTALRKALTLKENGRFSDRRPDWVGLWDINIPSRGYFEMFLDQKQNDIICGTIEDNLGTAAFGGRITNKEFSFLKEYVAGVESAASVPVHYMSEKKHRKHSAFAGTFQFGHAQSPFYIEEPRGFSPAQMAEEWFKLTKPK